MTREEKQNLVSALAEKLQEFPHFYLVDMGGLNAADTSLLRRKCFEQGLQLVMVKNTLFRIALKSIGKEDVADQLEEALKGSSSVFFSQVANQPAKLIKEFRKGKDKPILKAAYVEESLYFGDNQVDILSKLKSRDELIADVVALLQSPIKNVTSALLSGGQLLSGLVKSLSERVEN